jgi:geranylgeranyl pyrophosphate synthase
MSEPQAASQTGLAPFALIGAELAEVEHRLKEVLAQENELVQRVSDYLLKAPGKRVRPALVLLSARALGKKPPASVGVAAAVELIHMATLVHDDIIDRGEMRRGLPALRRAFNDQVAVLAGDFLFARAFQLLAQTSNPALVGVAADVVRTVCVGEIQETLEVGQPISEAAYLTRIDAKTAALLSASCRLGALAAGGGPRQVEALALYGRHIGMAYQLYDDILDLVADADQLGKAVAADFTQGVYTLPVVYALERWPDANGLRAVLGRGDAEARSAARRILEETGALDDARRLAEGHVAEALASLRMLKPGPARAALEQLAGFVVTRPY